MRYYQFTNEDIGRRSFLKGLGAAVGLGAVGYGAVQQKNRGPDTVGEPTTVQNRSDDVPTQPGAPSAPSADKPRIQKYSPEILKQYIIKYAQKHLPNNQVAPFIAQVDHESHGFRSMEENLNYSAGTLSSKYPKTFPRDISLRIVNHPRKMEIIANQLYSNRSGNGDYESGEGYRYRGRGYIQLTGKANYEKYGKLIGVNLVDNPDLASQPELAAKIAIMYWRTRVAKDGKIGNIAQVTKNISGNAGQGIKSRTEKLKRYTRELGKKPDQKQNSKSK